MTTEEFHRLMGFHNAKKNAPYTNNVGRRHAKGRAMAVGQVLKKSFVKSTSVERVFLSHA